MDESTFQELSDILLQSLCDAVEICDEEQSLEIDYIEDVVTITTPDGDYVINKHEPTKQIWISSPYSGSNKFAFDEDEDEWMPVNRSGRNLRDFLSVEFSNYLNLDLEF